MVRSVERWRSLEMAEGHAVVHIPQFFAVFCSCALEVPQQPVEQSSATFSSRQLSFSRLLTLKVSCAQGMSEYRWGAEPPTFKLLQI